MLSRQPMYTILIVDDNPKNLFTLRTLLELELSAEILEADSGSTTLEKISQGKIDLILLDIQMPDMDGFEVARFIRQRKKYQHIPIIFLTAYYKSDEFKHKGLEGGAIDYLTKPIDDDILMNRVKAYLRVIEGERAINLELERINRDLQREITLRKEVEGALHKLNEELEQRVTERTQELQQANIALERSLEELYLAQGQLILSEKMAALGGLVAGVSHEISTPLGVGVTAASNLELHSRDLKQRFEEGKMTKSDFLKHLDTTIESSAIILRNLQRASEQIKGFKQVAVDQSSEEKRRFRMKVYIEEILLNLHPKLKKTPHHINVSCPEDLELNSYPGAFSQIFTNFIMNSLIHGFEHKEQGQINIEVAQKGERLTMCYRDDGQGIPAEGMQKIFEPFYTTKRDQGGSGLGLNIIHNLVTHQLGGSIVCQSIPGKGTTFQIDIPICPE